MMKAKAVSALIVGAALVGTLAFVALPASAEDFYLIAKEFDKTLPDSTMVKMWGFAEDPAGACYAAPSTSSTDCTDPVASSPGPRLSVSPAATGVTIYVTNLLTTAAGGEGVSVTIPGQPAPSPAGPTWTDGSVGAAGTPGVRRVRSWGVEAAPGGGQATYTWSGANALRDGTYLYHSGTHPQVQVQMGLYGALTRDDVSGGPAPTGIVDNGTSLIDYDTGLEWLDLTVTKDLSPSAALLLPAASGYAVALDTQVTQLFANAGFELPLATGSSAADFLPASNLLSFLGCTLGCTGNFPQGRGFADRVAAPGLYVRPFYSRALVTSLGDGVVATGFNNGTAGVTDNGVFLVRAIPAFVSNGIYGTSFDNEVLVIYSEIDPVLHAAVTSGTYTTSTIDYQPQYFLVNGEPFATKAAATISGPAVGKRTLLRLLNAGLQIHTPSLQGMRMTIIAEDGNAYPWPRDEHSALLAPLKTKDAILTPTAEATHALYDGMLNLSSTDGSVGGMLSFLEIGPGALPANTAPVAVNDPAVAGDYDVNQNTSLTIAAPGVLGNDSDADGHPLTAVLGATTVSNGTLALNADGSFVYTPTFGYAGPDSFTYKASDGAADSPEATAAITVVAVANNPPVADDKSVTTGQQNAGGNSEAVAIVLTGSDPDGNVVFFEVTGGPTNGSLTGMSPLLTYTPNLGFDGPDSFTYKATDVPNLADSLVDAVVEITVVANQAPTANVDSFMTPENTVMIFDLTANDTDPDPNGTIDVTTVVIEKQPKHGVVSSNGDGTVTYDPDDDYAGTDSFRYRVEDDDGELSRNPNGGTRTKVRVNIVPLQ